MMLLLRIKKLSAIESGDAILTTIAFSEIEYEGLFISLKSVELKSGCERGSSTYSPIPEDRIISNQTHPDISSAHSRQ